MKRSASPPALLLLAAQAAGDPGRQFGKVGRNQLDGHAGVGQRLQPGGLFLAPVEPGQRHQQQASGDGRAQ
jgi:hypothetical protein